MCTLCSCYPSAVLGMAPAWYKSRSYRARGVREPRSVLSEFGCEVGEEQRVTVHDSTADCRYMVLPRRPEKTEGWRTVCNAACPMFVSELAVLHLGVCVVISM